MADFPDTIYEARETENLPGIVFDPDNKRNLYSDDFQGLASEISAIETYLETLYAILSVVDDELVNTSANPCYKLVAGAGGQAKVCYYRVGDAKFVHGYRDATQKYVIAVGAGLEANEAITIDSSKVVALPHVPTSASGLSSGDIWCDTTGGLNILKVV